MFAPVKHKVLVLVAAMLMSAFSTFFAITLVRLIRQHHTEDHGDLAPQSPEP
jgi:hypothetical protein